MEYLSRFIVNYSRNRSNIPFEANDVNLSLEKVTQVPTLGHFTFNEST